MEHVELAIAARDTRELDEVEPGHALKLVGGDGLAHAAGEDPNVDTDVHCLLDEANRTVAHQVVAPLGMERVVLVVVRAAQEARAGDRLAVFGKAVERVAGVVVSPAAGGPFAGGDRRVKQSPRAVALGTAGG